MRMDSVIARALERLNWRAWDDIENPAILGVQGQAEQTLAVMLQRAFENWVVIKCALCL